MVFFLSDGTSFSFELAFYFLIKVFDRDKDIELDLRERCSKLGVCEDWGSGCLID